MNEWHWMKWITTDRPVEVMMWKLDGILSVIGQHEDKRVLNPPDIYLNRSHNIPNGEYLRWQRLKILNYKPTHREVSTINTSLFAIISSGHRWELTTMRQRPWLWKSLMGSCDLLTRWGLTNGWETTIKLRRSIYSLSSSILIPVRPWWIFTTDDS